MHGWRVGEIFRIVQGTETLSFVLILIKNLPVFSIFDPPEA